MDILYEDNHLLVINKQPDWVVQGANLDQASLLDWGKVYLKEKYQKPGNVFLGVVSRLDAGVTGAVPFARTSKGASRLSEQMREHQMDKRYWALVEGAPPKTSATLRHWLSRGPTETVTRVHSSAIPGSQIAELHYDLLGQTSEDFVRKNGQPALVSLLEIQLITGRKHQIRAQMQAIGTPIVGDRKYGSKLSFHAGIGLHCRRLQFKHPTQDFMVDVVAPTPSYWPKIS